MEYHNLTKSVEYMAWRNMKERCYNSKRRDYPMYGGRGIRVSDSWLGSFLTFLADVGPRPSKNHSLDRSDNSGPYSKENCSWKSKAHQMDNRRSTIYINGKPLRQLAEELGVDRSKVYSRLHIGWSIDEALGKAPRNGRIWGLK